MDTELSKWTLGRLYKFYVCIRLYDSSVYDEELMSKGYIVESLIKIESRNVSVMDITLEGVRYVESLPPFLQIGCFLDYRARGFALSDKRLDKIFAKVSISEFTPYLTHENGYIRDTAKELFRMKQGG